MLGHTAVSVLERSGDCFSIKDSYGIKKVTSKKNSHFSNLVPFIRPRGRRIYPGVEFLGTALKFRKRKRISSTCVHVLHNASHKEIYVVVLQ